jgi:hypothetical protein
LPWVYADQFWAGGGDHGAEELGSAFWGAGGVGGDEHRPSAIAENVRPTLGRDWAYTRPRRDPGLIRCGWGDGQNVG